MLQLNDLEDNTVLTCAGGYEIPIHLVTFKGLITRNLENVPHHDAPNSLWRGAWRLRDRYVIATSRSVAAWCFDKRQRVARLESSAAVIDRWYSHTEFMHCQLCTPCWQEARDAVDLSMVRRRRRGDRQASYI